MANIDKYPSVACSVASVHLQVMLFFTLLFLLFLLCCRLGFGSSFPTFSLMAKCYLAFKKCEYSFIDV